MNTCGLNFLCSSKFLHKITWCHGNPLGFQILFFQRKKAEKQKTITNECFSPNRNYKDADYCNSDLCFASAVRIGGYLLCITHRKRWIWYCHGIPAIYSSSLQRVFCNGTLENVGGILLFLAMLNLVGVM